MDAERHRSDDIQPLKIRRRQVFSGSGETSVVESVYCPAQGRAMSPDACQACGHGHGGYDGPGDPSVFCDQAGARDTPRHAHKARGGVQPDATPVAEVMTTHVLCVRPDVSIDALIALMVERKISGVPVVDARGAPIGIISKTDIVRHRFEAEDTSAVDDTLESGFHARTLIQATVADLMTPVPIAFCEDAPISQVAAAMVYEGVHRLPIVAEDGTVVGIVSSLDVVGWYTQREGYKQGMMRRA